MSAYFNMGGNFVWGMGQINSNYKQLPIPKRSDYSVLKASELKYALSFMYNQFFKIYFVTKGFD